MTHSVFSAQRSEVTLSSLWSLLPAAVIISSVCRPSVRRIDRYA